MKLKQDPGDFQVVELTDVTPTDKGLFAFYQLEKRGWTTPDALQALRRRWKIHPRRLSYAGLKDRHALTLQYLTIHHGPRQGLTHHGVKVEYLGQISAPYTTKDLRANRFQITLRDVALQKMPAALQALTEIRADGVPNYFDDQRFGSVNCKQAFMARSLILGRYEEALQQALAAPYAHDGASQKKEKAILNMHWGDWQTCKQLLPKCHARSLVDYLVHHPADFRGAVARLRPELRGLYLAAYQSHLWNRMLATWLKEHCRPEQLIPIRLRLGDVPMPRALDPAQRTALAALQLPLPSARLKLDPADPRAHLIHAVLADEGFPLNEMRIRGLREPFFSKGERAALCLPTLLEHEISSDERHPGRRKLVLHFELPRGSYATLLVKRVQQSGNRPSQHDG